MKGFLVFLFLMVGFSSHSQNGIPAKKLLEDALLKAKAEKKNVFVIVTATWCGPCKELKRGITDVYISPFFEKHYVFLELYESELGENKKNENEGTHDILIAFKGDTTAVPYWFILNSNSVKLADSYIYKKNPKDPLEKPQSGFSSNPDDLMAFIKVLKRTSKLTDQELQLISERFLQLTRAVD